MATLQMQNAALKTKIVAQAKLIADYKAKIVAVSLGLNSASIEYLRSIQFTDESVLALKDLMSWDTTVPEE